MSQAPTFFERDLSEAEADSLDAALQADPAVAAALVAEAERRYQATGLPQPRWDERAAKRLPKGWWLAVLVLAGAGAWALNLHETRAHVIEVPSIDDKLRIVMVPAEREAQAGAVVTEEVHLDKPVAATGPSGARQGRSLGVVLHLKETAPVRVEVRDAQGRLRRLVFDGSAAKGERRFTWDGLDSARNAVEAGDYRIVVTTGGRELVQTVKIKKQS